MGIASKKIGYSSGHIKTCFSSNFLVRTREGKKYWRSAGIKF